MLARAQADLAMFRSRQQLASSQTALEAQQTAMMALDARRAELEADRATFGALFAQLKKGGAAGESEALRASASSPAHGRQPYRRHLLPSARELSVPAGLHVHRCRGEPLQPTPI